MCLELGKAIHRRYSRYAIHEVHHAIRRGELPPAQTFRCKCGEVANQYDHRNYAHPLVVRPVCDKCNIRAGSGRLHVGIVMRDWMPYFGATERPKPVVVLPKQKTRKR